MALTSQLNDLAGELHGELTNGDVDFEKLVDLADQISENADSLAGAFARVNEALSEPLEHDSESNGSSTSSESSSGSQNRSSQPRSSGKSARPARSRSRKATRASASRG